MSNLIFNETKLNKDLIQSKKITIQRHGVINLGVRLWFQIQTTEGEMFQRWSLMMNPTDEVLFLCKEGDTLSITYIEDTVEDPVNYTFESFTRKLILSASFE